MALTFEEVEDWTGKTGVLESLQGETWKPLGKATVAEDGSYQLAVRLGSGVFRTRVPAVRGFAEGLSPQLRLGQ